MDTERRRHILLGGQQASQVDRDLADLVIRARYFDAVAAWRRRRAANKVIVLIGSNDEQGVAGIDAIAREAGKEGVECGVVRLEYIDVRGLPGPVGSGSRRRFVRVVRVADIAPGDRHAVLLHRGDVRQGDPWREPVKARESDMTLGILDRLAVQVDQRTAGRDVRRHFLVAEEPFEPVVPARFLRQAVSLAAGAHV